MKCVHCGGEFTADQLQENQGACPHCGQPQQMEADPQPEETKEPTSDPQEKPDKPETAAPHKRSSLPLIVGAVVIILALAAVLWAVLGTGGQQVTAEQHNNPTVLTAFSDDAIRFAIGDELVAMYTNDAEDETERQYIANGLSISTPYIGSRNYVELANGEVVYLPMSFETSAEMVGKLYVRTADGEEKVLSIMTSRTVPPTVSLPSCPASYTLLSQLLISSDASTVSIHAETPSGGTSSAGRMSLFQAL